MLDTEPFQDVLKTKKEKKKKKKDLIYIDTCCYTISK